MSGKYPKLRVKPDEKINMLTLISYAGELDETGEPIWLCRCDCGEYTKALLNKVLHKVKKDCGCVHADLIRALAMDLRGRRFGMLRAVSLTGEKTLWNEYIWLCECDCGSFIEVTTHYLTSSPNPSCGCYARELLTSESDGMLHQDATNIGVIMNKEPKRLSATGVRGVTFRKRSKKWLAGMVFQKKTVLYKEYATFEEAVEARRKAEEEYHIPALERYKAYHGIPSDGSPRKEAPERRKRGAASGVPGVTFYPSKQKWRARLIVKQIPVLDKLFDKMDDAIAARKEAETKYRQGDGNCG